MKKYAQVIVNIPAAEVDKVYDYLVPPDRENEYKIGHVIQVPFGSRRVIGFIIGFSENTDVSSEKIKQLDKKILKDRVFDKKMLDLFKWMAYNYNSYLSQVIKTALPAGIIQGRVSVKKKKFICLNESEDIVRKKIKEIKNRAPKQARILEIFADNPHKEFTVQELINTADCYRGAVYRLMEKGVLDSCKRIQRRKLNHTKSKKESKVPSLTSDQNKAISSVQKAFNSSEIFLLHGVTGSGKTEVYLQLADRLLKQGQGTIILVPEISLTPIMVRRFYSRFKDKIAVLHSGLSEGERYDEWRRIKRGEAKIVIGARSAVFAPLDDPGLIVIDEEHENSYKQETYPHYHARRVAFVRGKISNFPVLLGSATPSLESFYYTEKNFIHYLSLSKRINERGLPPVDIIDMSAELKKGNTGIFSASLKDSITRTLKKDKQVLLFLNRRGYASFMMCRECGFVIKCRNCDISLTYHSAKNSLCCHYCGHTRRPAQKCPECDSEYIKEFGIGTEKIVQEVKEEFPEAEVDRMDVDTTVYKGAHEDILARMEKGETDILVGTQMIAKGHDYPGIEVVGVISADTMLNIPDFRSAERTFQLMTQVAGRAGRGSTRGQVYIQTYNPDHYSIQAARNHDYEAFYKNEIKLRKELNYPPFCFLVNILVRGTQKEIVKKEIKKLGQKIHKQHHSSIMEIMGPSPAPIPKIRGKFRWQIILKFAEKKLRKKILNKLKKEVQIQENKNDVSFVIDVDPQSML